MDKARVYLAGPEVFSPEAKEMGRLSQWTCSNYGLKGLYPLDNEIEANGKHETAQAIVKANIELIDSCDYIILYIIQHIQGLKIKKRLLKDEICD